MNNSENEWNDNEECIRMRYQTIIYVKAKLMKKANDN